LPRHTELPNSPVPHRNEGGLLFEKRLLLLLLLLLLQLFLP
jgi:hypothetical protein